MENLLSSTALVAGFLGLAQPAVPLNWQAPAPLELVLTQDDQPPVTVRNATGGGAWVMCPGFINTNRPDFDISVSAGASPEIWAETIDTTGSDIASLILYDSRGAWHCVHAYDGQITAMLPEQPGGVVNVWIGMDRPTQQAQVRVGASNWADRLDEEESENTQSLGEDNGFYTDESFTFTTDFGNTTVVIDENGAVSGSYDHKNGRLNGNLHDDGMVSGRWSQAPSYRGADSGEFEFVLTASGCFLDGRWRYAGEPNWHNDWKGKRIGGGC